MRPATNTELYRLYVAGRSAECRAACDAVLHKHGGLHEYALYLLGTLARRRGDLAESLTLYEGAAGLNGSSDNVMQVGVALCLLGKHKQALGVLAEAKTRAAQAKARSRDAPSGWLVAHHTGRAHFFLEDHAAAAACLEEAVAVAPHESTYLLLAKVLAATGDDAKAVRVLADGLDRFDTVDLRVEAGLAYARLGESERAFAMFGSALATAPRDFKALLAAGSIIQDNDDHDVALSKYRVAAVAAPDSAELWNNIALALFGKRKAVAAGVCLKRALYLLPTEWIIAHNLGLVMLHSGMHASAFHYLSAAANLNPRHGQTFMLLGICLARLEDDASAEAALRRAVALDAEDGATQLNLAVVLYNAGRAEAAADELEAAERLLAAAEDEEFEELQATAKALRRELAPRGEGAAEEVRRRRGASAADGRFGFGA